MRSDVIIAFEHNFVDWIAAKQNCMKDEPKEKAKFQYKPYAKQMSVSMDEILTASRFSITSKVKMITLNRHGAWNRGTH